MWLALNKLDVSHPQPLVNLIRSFHEDTKVKISLGGVTLDEISLQNGLRQNYCMAPVLFNLYTCLIVERWLARIGE